MSNFYIYILIGAILLLAALGAAILLLVRRRHFSRALHGIAPPALWGYNGQTPIDNPLKSVTDPCPTTTRIATIGYSTESPTNP